MIRDLLTAKYLAPNNVPLAIAGAFRAHGLPALDSPTFFDDLPVDNTADLSNIDYTFTDPGDKFVNTFNTFRHVFDVYYSASANNQDVKIHGEEASRFFTEQRRKIREDGSRGILLSQNEINTLFSTKIVPLNIEQHAVYAYLSRDGTITMYEPNRCSLQHLEAHFREKYDPSNTFASKCPGGWCQTWALFMIESILMNRTDIHDLIFNYYKSASVDPDLPVPPPIQKLIDAMAKNSRYGKNARKMTLSDLVVRLALRYQRLFEESTTTEKIETSIEEARQRTKLPPYPKIFHMINTKADLVGTVIETINGQPVSSLSFEEVVQSIRKEKADVKINGSIFTRDKNGQFPFAIWRYPTTSGGCIGGDVYPVIAKQIERIVRKASVERRLDVLETRYPNRPKLTHRENRATYRRERLEELKRLQRKRQVFTDLALL